MFVVIKISVVNLIWNEPYIINIYFWYKKKIYIHVWNTDFPLALFSFVLSKMFFIPIFSFYFLHPQDRNRCRILLIIDELLCFWIISSMLHFAVCKPMLMSIRKRASHQRQFFVETEKHLELVLYSNRKEKVRLVCIWSNKNKRRAACGACYWLLKDLFLTWASKK